MCGLLNGPFIRSTNVMNTDEVVGKHQHRQKGFRTPRLKPLRIAIGFPVRKIVYFRLGKAWIFVGNRPMEDLFAWMFSFFALVTLLVVVIYQLMCLADLEFDYINPYDSSSRINTVVLPEFIGQGILTCFYVLTGHWVMALLSLPYLYYNVRLYLNKQHLVDVTEIYNMVKWEKKQRLFKLGHIALLLFLSLFWLIYSALEDHEG